MGEGTAGKTKQELIGIDEEKHTLAEYAKSDLLMIVGTITEKQGPALRRVWEQMAEPKWVIAFGVCASTGGFYQNYNTVPGCDQVVPVDVYIPGCPPRPEQVLDGLILLQKKIQEGTTYVQRRDRGELANKGHDHDAAQQLGPDGKKRLPVVA